MDSRGSSSTRVVRDSWPKELLSASSVFRIVIQGNQSYNYSLYQQKDRKIFMRISIEDAGALLIQPVPVIAGQAVALDGIVGLAVGAHLRAGPVLQEVPVETLKALPGIIVLLAVDVIARQASQLGVVRAVPLVQSIAIVAGRAFLQGEVELGAEGVDELALAGIQVVSFRASIALPVAPVRTVELGIDDAGALVVHDEAWVAALADPVGRLPAVGVRDHAFAIGIEVGPHRAFNALGAIE